MPRDLDSAQHVAAFHRSDEFIVEHVAAFITAGLDAGERVVVLATQGHWNAITKRLEQGATCVGRATADARLVLVEADALVELLTVDGRVNVDAFRATLEPLIAPGGKIRIYGEVVSLLAARGDAEGALALERLGNELTRAHDVNILCGYHVPTTNPLQPADIVRIQDAHERCVFEEPVRAGTATQLPGHAHAVRFYRDAQSLARIVGQFLDEGLSAGSSGIVIATPEHSAAIEASLRALNHDMDHLLRSGLLVVADAEQTLARIMVDGMPDGALFRNEVGPLIERASRGGSGHVVRAYGEMVDRLWRAGQTGAAIKLEVLWNQLAQSHEFSLLCGYAMGHFYKAAPPRELCTIHTHASSDRCDSGGEPWPLTTAAW